jgi:two-component system sensor histidine kinase/response regulator
MSRSAGASPVALGPAKERPERSISARGDLMASAEGLRLIFEYGPDSLCVIDGKGRVVALNRRAEQLSAYAHGDVVGRSLLTFGLLADDQVRMASDLLAKCLEGQAVGPEELVFKTKDGLEVPVEISACPVLIGGETYVLMAARDITERKRLEEQAEKNQEDLWSVIRERTRELEKAKQAADSANRAKSSFLASMSHEIRTPMNAILGYAQLMQRDEGLAPPLRKHLDVISRSGEHLLALINDILEMSKIEAGRITLNQTSFSLRAMLEDLEMMFRARTDAKSIDFKVECPADIPRYIEGDEGKLRQVFMNLLSNAVKFTEAGRVVLRVRLDPAGPGRLRLTGEVEDTGPGISEKEQAGLFSPFYQAERGRRMGTGTGLGLAISRQFARLMGGEISVRSRLGQGSLFAFHIQLGESEVTEAEQKSESVRIQHLRPGQPAYRVLVVDDEEVNSTLCAQMLGNVGFQTARAANGKDALVQFSVWRPQLILMDMRLPVMDGAEAIRRIRTSPGGRDIKIISVTAGAFEQDQEEAFAAGADDFLAKPFREAELFGKIGALLGAEYVLSKPAATEPATEQEPGAGERGESKPADLPPEFVRRMCESLVQADYDIMMRLIDEEAGLAAPTRAELRRCLENFEYTRLLRMFQDERRTS